VELAKSCDYAIRGLLFLAQRPNPFEPVILREIAERAQAPEAFMSKVFQSLRASNLVHSHRGKVRGYSLARSAREISLYDVVVAVEGPAAIRTIPPGAALPTTEASFRCVWAELEEQVAATMKRTTLRSILSRTQEGRA